MSSLLMPVLLAIWPCYSSAQKVDHRFAPANYQTVICYPDDWQKTMVSERGGLSYDFGPGPYARPLTEITVGVAGTRMIADRQFLDDARIPVVTTTLRADSTLIRLTSFAMLPAKPTVYPATPTWNKGRVRREGGMNGCIGWASPPDSVDDAFRNAAWGTNRPILYRVSVEPGSSRRIALGICESYKAQAGMRPLELRVEGAAPQVVDPMASGVKNTPQVLFFDGTDVNGDGWLNVESHSAGPDGNTILNAFWVFRAHVPMTAAQVMSGEGSRRAELVQRCGTELEENAPALRADAIIAEFSQGARAPQVLVKTRRPLTPAASADARSEKPSGLCLTTHHETGTDPEPYLFSRPRPASMKRTSDGWLLEYSPHTARVEIVVVHGNHGEHLVKSIPDTRNELAATREYWLNQKTFPVGGIAVPDSGIQMLLDAAVRTIYQVRERVDGIAQFQPGPSVYRGLWIADAVLTGIPVAMLGDTASLYRYLETGFRSQLPTGQVRTLYPTVSIVETPAWAFAAFWVARATGDHSWIAAHWTELGRALDWICSLREQTLGDQRTPFYGLLPAGFVDGGLSIPMSDYGTLWWCMMALEEGSHAAELLGQGPRAAAWRSTLQGFASSFAVAARRDILRDHFGNPFLPVGVGDTAVSVPQRGQFALLLPIHFASFFDAPGSLTDSLARMNLIMLENYLSQGLIRGSGWMPQGLWPWLGGVFGMAHQRIGDSRRAVELMYAYANHAAPTGVWVEEQLPRAVGPGTAGDVSDAEASAVFIHLTRYLLATERKDGLELLGGVPEAWLRPGAVVGLSNTLSEFGPLTFELRVGEESAVLTVAPISGHRAPGGPYLSTRALRGAGFTLPDGRPLPDKLRWEWQKSFRAEFKRRPLR
ncbi:MAG: hypothetical protein NTU47_14930 [Ignavibacteriales bacterium]|nr:hypothetical protein [Ignavibacteriales bacterium]